MNKQYLLIDEGKAEVDKVCLSQAGGAGPFAVFVPRSEAGPAHLVSISGEDDARAFAKSSASALGQDGYSDYGADVLPFLSHYHPVSDV